MQSGLEKRPIGIFDSGIGGLTVASAINKVLPNETLIYFGDTAHLPYGEKSSVSIRGFSAEIASFLVNQGCKAIVIACNSASAVATNTVRRVVPSSIPVINVIDPTVNYVASEIRSGRVGVIATKATVNSRIYARRIVKQNQNLKVSMLATPLLVSMIEEGFFNNNISQAIINSYLEKSTLQNIEALILGCTHFPLIKKEIEKHYSGSVQVIDSSDTVAQELKRILDKKNILNTGKPNRKHHFYVSDLTPAFAESTAIFFGEKLRLEKKKLWL